jgi:SWI/SNF-related matrix-associated actin-dependent regulator 1 of chromatin subfamily A
MELPREESSAIGVTLGPDALDRTLESAVERAFLSPRVVDQAAFDSLAGTLRKLTVDAQGQARSLASTSAQMGHLQESVRGLIKDLQTRIDHALKALPTLDTRISRTQALLDRVSNETALTKARELRDSIIQEVAAQRETLVRDALALALDGAKEKFAADLQTMVRDALDQARADAILSARGANAAEMSPPALAPASGISIPVESLAAIEQRLTLATSNAIATQLDALTLRAREALHEFEAGVERVEARLAAIQAAAERDIERAEQGEKSLEEAVLRAEMRLRTASADAERRTEAVATEIAEQLLALRADAGTMVQAGREQLATHARDLSRDLTRELTLRLDEQVERASRESIAAQAERVASHAASANGNPPTNEPAAASTPVAPAILPDTSADFARLAAARTQIEALLHQLDQSRTAVAAAARHCDDRTLAAAIAMDTIESRFAALRAQAQQAEVGASTARPPTDALATPPRLEQTQAQLQAFQLQQVTAQAIQVGQWLTQLLQAAQFAPQMQPQPPRR